MFAAVYVTPKEMTLVGVFSTFDMAQVALKDAMLNNIYTASTLFNVFPKHKTGNVSDFINNVSNDPAITVEHIVGSFDRRIAVPEIIECTLDERLY